MLRNILNILTETLEIRAQRKSRSGILEAGAKCKGNVKQDEFRYMLYLQNKKKQLFLDKALGKLYAT